MWGSLEDLPLVSRLHGRVKAEQGVPGRDMAGYQQTMAAHCALENMCSTSAIHLKKTQAFDSIAGNTVVPYRSLKKFFNYHKLLYFAIYNHFCQIVLKSDFK